MDTLSLLEGATIPEKSTSDGLRLKEVVLPAGLVPGFDVEWPGSGTGNKLKYELEGYDGFKFIGQGRDETHIIPELSAQFATVVIGPGAKRVEFHGVTIHGAYGQGKGRAVHYGTENLPLLGIPQKRLTLVFADYGIVADEPDAGPWVKTAPAGNTSVWGTFGYNAELFCLRGLVDWRRGAEHAYYPHGVDGQGILYDQIEVLGSGAEIFKIATRPEEAYPTPGATMLVKDCVGRDWNQPWSWRGGGGVVAQGSGINIFVIGCQFYGGPGNQKSRCVMIDDGGADRFYNAITGEPGTGPANGWVFIDRTLAVGDGTENWGTIARIGTLSPWANILQARGYAVTNSGFYTRLGALQTKLEISGLKDIILEGNNTPAIRSAVDALVAIGTEANVVGPGTFPLSANYRGGRFATGVEPVPPTS